MWEPRLTLNFSTVGGAELHLQPQLNHASTPTVTGGHRRGMYFTGWLPVS